MANNDFDLPRPTDPVPSSSSIVANDNSKVLDYLVNGTGTVVTRTGKQLTPFGDVIDSYGFGLADFTFAEGGVLTGKNLLVLGGDVYYKYIGTGSFPLTVTAGTNPVGNTDWLVTVTTTLQALSGLTERSDLAQRSRFETTISYSTSNFFDIGDKLVITDLNNAKYDVVPPSDASGFYIGYTSNGNKLKLNLDVDYIDAAWLGAKNDSGVTHNNAIFRTALLLAKNNGIGEVRVGNTQPTGWFGLEQINGTSAILQQSNVDFIGVGTPELRPIVDTDTFMVASIFITGNYHPNFYQGVPKESVTISGGSSVINVASSSAYDVGSIIFVTSQNYHLSASFPVYEYMELARVVDHLSSTEIRVDSYIDFDGAGYVAKASDNGVDGRFGIPLFVLENSKISNFKVKTLDYINPDSGTFNCEISNISGVARGGLYGNLFTRTKFDAWDLECLSTFSELSFGSHNNTMTNIRLYDGESGSASGIGLSWQESGRHNTLDGFEFIFNGNTPAIVPMRIQDHSHSVCKNGVIKIKSNTNSVFAINSYGLPNVAGTVASGYENITVISENGVPVVVDVLQQGTSGSVNKCFARDISYFGVRPSVSTIRMTGDIDNNVSGFDCSLYVNGDNLPTIISNTTESVFKLTGDFNVDEMLSIQSAGNEVKLYSNRRMKIRGLNTTEKPTLSITSTSVNNVFKEYILPSNSITNRDNVKINIELSTAGVAGNKNVQVGFLDELGEFKSVSMVIGGERYGALNATFKVRDLALTLGNLRGEYWTKIGSDPTEFDTAVATGNVNVTSSDLVLQLRAWVDTSGDSIFFENISVKVDENNLN